MMTQEELFWSRMHKGPTGNSHVLHRCDTPACVNPDHLFLGTHQDNMADMLAKGRYDYDRKGEKAARAKLTEAQVRYIRNSKETLKQLAGRFGVAISTVEFARSGRSWKHLPKSSQM